MSQASPATPTLKPTNPKIIQPIPALKGINNGDNLLMYPPDEMYQFYEVYEIFLEELQNCNISFFGALPNLHKLSIRFSNISLMDEREYLSCDYTCYYIIGRSYHVS